MAMAMMIASWSRSAAFSWESPVQCAAATKSSAQALAAFASNAAPVRAVASCDGDQASIIERRAARVAARGARA